MSKDQLELISLPGRGRAEGIRLMLIYCEKKFVDTRLTIAQWKARRKIQGFEDDTKLPVMKVNNTKTFIGVLDISRYIAMHYGLYGSSSVEQDDVNGVINVLEALNNQLSPIIRATLTKNYEQRKQFWDKFKQESLIPQLQIYEKELSEREFIVGSKFSWADIALIEMLTRFQCCYDSFYLAHFPVLKAYCSRFETLSHVRLYIQTRPESHF